MPSIKILTNFHPHPGKQNPKSGSISLPTSDFVQQLPFYSESEDLPGNEDPSGPITAEQA
jgi:hypothetical protein